jgi:hypothetical protein
MDLNRLNNRRLVLKNVADFLQGNPTDCKILACWVLQAQPQPAVSVIQILSRQMDTPDASFNRYQPGDAQCCASRESRLFYEVDTSTNPPVLVPQLPASSVDRPMPE